MAAPAFNNVQTQGNPAATTNPSTTCPTTAANDILILVRINGGATALPAPGGSYSGGAWTTIDSDTWTTGAGAVMWSRCTGNHSGETVNAVTVDSGSLLLIKITGAITTGSPIDQASVTGVTLGAVAGGALTGVATTAVDTLVCYTGAVDDNQTASAPTVGGAAMSNFSFAASTGGADSRVWYADNTQAVPGATGNFAITNAAGTAEGKRVSAFAILSARHVVLGASAASASATLALTTGASTGIGKVQLGLLRGPYPEATFYPGGTTSYPGYFAEIAAPEAGTQTLSIRARASAGSGILRTTLYDSDGVTARGTDDFTLTGSFQTFTLTPSAGIVDWSALQVAFEGRGSGLTAEVSWIELRVPQSAGAGAVDIPLNPSAATASATLAVTASATVELQSAAAVSSSSLALTALTRLTLGQTDATSTASLALKASTTVSLGSAAAVAVTSLALATPARITLASAAASSSATLALNAPLNVALGASAAQSAATLSLKATPNLTLASAAISSATLALKATTRVPLNPAVAISTASLMMFAGFIPATHPDLGGDVNEVLTGGPVNQVLTGGPVNQVITNGVFDQVRTGGEIAEDHLGGEVAVAVTGGTPFRRRIT